MDSLFASWMKEGRLISICPEMAGGLPTPRPPAEMINGKVLSNQGEDVSDAFQRGAEAALQLCQKYQIKIAILKARNPSCGNEEIYDGTFSGQVMPGQGVTAALLTQHGVQVFNENQIELVAKTLS